MSMTFFCAISMLFLSYLFVTAGYKKLSDVGNLRKTITDYRVLPGSWSRPVASVLPVFEVLVGIGLLIPPLHEVAAIALCVALLSYTSAIAVNIARGRRDLDCGCAGPGAEQLVSGSLLVRNAVLFIPALALVFSPVSQRDSLDTSGIILALAAASLCALIYQVINQLLSNQDKLRRLASHG
jgi:uncharacterized membrane protein YphA (DoxX/SURF4 family)